MDSLARRCCIVDCVNDYLSEGYCALHLHFKDKKTQHRLSGGPEYNSWRSMNYRCYKNSHVSYHRYGGRGIRVCDEWHKSFLAFYKDMGRRPEGTTLERINNDGNYEPSNCKWGTREEQSQNRGTRSISGHSYIYFDARNNNWRYSITIDNKRRYKCGYKTKELAILARETHLNLLEQ